jgi:hypothetical protein
MGISKIYIVKIYFYRFFCLFKVAATANIFKITSMHAV